MPAGPVLDRILNGKLWIFWLFVASGVGNIGLGRLFHVVQRKTLYTLIALLAVAASSVGVYYYLGYASVGSVHLALELAIFRTRAPDNTSITFHIPTMFWSSQMPLDVDANSLSFTLEADSITIARIAPEGAIIHSHHCLVFPLDFKTTNSSDAEFLARRASNNVVLSVAARLTAGLYSQNFVQSLSQSVYDTIVFRDLYACTLDILPSSSNV